MRSKRKFAPASCYRKTAAGVILKDIYAIIDWHYVGDNTYDRITETSTFWEYHKQHGKPYPGPQCGQ
ncbi:MAG: hypothetical protein ABII09_11290 [Planctomycetota bacterium]